MLQNYIQTLKDLYERLSQQNLNTPADILTAWKLTAQIMLASIVPVLIIVTAIAAHVYLYKIILRKFYLKREAALEVGLYITAGYALLFTTLDFMFLSVLFKKWNDEYTRPRLAAETKKEIDEAIQRAERSTVK